MLTDDRETYERASLVAHHPARLDQCLTMEEYRRFIATGLGWNYRIHMLAAAIGVVQMERFGEAMALRRANADRISRDARTHRGTRAPAVVPLRGPDGHAWIRTETDEGTAPALPTPFGTVHATLGSPVP